MSVYGLRATPGDHGLTVRGKVLCGVQVPVQDHRARHGDLRTLRGGQFGFHRTTSRAGLTRREPPVEHNDAATVAHRFVLQLAADLPRTKHPRHAGQDCGCPPSRRRTGLCTTTAANLRASLVVSLWVQSLRWSATLPAALASAAVAARQRFDGCWRVLVAGSYGPTLRDSVRASRRTLRATPPACR